MKTGLYKLAVSVLLSMGCASVFAAPVSISSYDMTGVYYNNFGYYDGTITNAGQNSYTYTGGSGTINDGKVETFYQNAYLFHYVNLPSVTLHLGEMATISSLSLFSFESDDNYFPGSIAGVNVTINGETRYIASEGFGPQNSISKVDHVHEYLNLIGSGLENLLTDTIILSGFVTQGEPGMYISEITIDGSPRAGGTVSEPEGLALLAGGVLGLAVMRRRQVNSAP